MRGKGDRVWKWEELKGKRRDLKRIVLQRGLRYSTSKPRDPLKWGLLKAFILQRIPPPEEILSGEYYRRRLGPIIQEILGQQDQREQSN